MDVRMRDTSPFGGTGRGVAAADNASSMPQMNF